MTQTVICLTDHPELDWAGRAEYIRAKFERRRTELYAMDLIWMIARRYYDIPTPSPTRYEMDHKPPDRRSAQQIKESFLKRLKGM